MSTEIQPVSTESKAKVKNQRFAPMPLLEKWLNGWNFWVDIDYKLKLIL